MQWISKTGGWRWRFAILPFSIRDDGDGQFRRWVWLEWYKTYDMGEYVAVELVTRDEEAKHTEKAG